MEKYKLTNNNWEIKKVDIRSDRKQIPCLFVDDKKLTCRDKIIFTCRQTNEYVEKSVGSFIHNPILMSRNACIGNKHKGKKISKKHREEISIKNSGEKIHDYFDFTCPVCGKTFSYRNTSNNRKRKYCSQDCQLVVWVKAPEFKGKMNNLEKYFCTILDDMGYTYKTQYLVKYYMVDFFFEDKNFIIQIDGDYWHVNPDIYPNGPTGIKQKQNINMDKKFKNYIDNYTDYNFIRIWEDEINNDLESVKNKIKRALN